MMQIVYCECGESTMLNGRCTGCKCVRPSSKELINDIRKAQVGIESDLVNLERAIGLETNDAKDAK